MQREDQHHGDPDGQQTRRLDAIVAEGQDVIGEEAGLVALRLRVGGDASDLAQHDEHADAGDDGPEQAVARLAQRLERDLVDDHRQRGDGDHHERHDHRERKREPRVEPKGEDRAHRGEQAVCQMQHALDREDEREAEGERGIDASDRDAAYELLQEEGQRRSVACVGDRPSPIAGTRARTADRRRR
jgi:hypothetical protein